MNNREKIVSQLNNILEISHDAEKGYQKASENVESEKLKSFFNEKFKERNDFSYRLKIEINTFWKEAKETGSIPGKLHRAWMDTKAFFTADNEEAMVNEAIAGEEIAINFYNTVLEETKLPASTKALLVEQKNSIQDGLRVLKNITALTH